MSFVPYFTCFRCTNREKVARGDRQVAPVDRIHSKSFVVESPYKGGASLESSLHLKEAELPDDPNFVERLRRGDKEACASLRPRAFDECLQSGAQAHG